MKIFIKVIIYQHSLFQEGLNYIIFRTLFLHVEFTLTYIITEEYGIYLGEIKFCALADHQIRQIEGYSLE